MPERADAERWGDVHTPANRMSMYWATLRRRWPLAVWIVCACLIAGVLVAALAPKQYDATAKVIIGQRAQLDALLGAADYNPDPERDVNTNVQLITQGPVADSASRRVGLGLSGSELTAKVQTAVDRNSNIVSISARDASPEGAARIANAFAVAYRQFRASFDRAAIEDAVLAAEQRRAELPPGADKDALDRELRHLRAAAAVQTGGVQIVDRASAGSAVPVRHIRSGAILAVLLGTVLAAVVIVVLARTDRRLRSPEDVEAAAGYPVLGTVPLWCGPKSEASKLDSLATLALSLDLHGLVPRREPQVLLVTSPRHGEGTPELTLGLAFALADLERRVVVIEADLRAPAFERLLGIGSTGGVGEILSGRSTFEEELVALSPGEGWPRAWALPAGSPTSLPQSLLASDRMTAVVEAARQEADIVVIAGAPSASFGDSRALVPLADAVLLVARIDVTDRDEVRTVMRELEDMDAPVVGAVATRGRSAEAGVLGPGRSGAGPPYATPPGVWASRRRTTNGSTAATHDPPEVRTR